VEPAADRLLLRRGAHVVLDFHRHRHEEQRLVSRRRRRVRPVCLVQSRGMWMAKL
jgi:hypothetical protein